jgi:hypothetical protein
METGGMVQGYGWDILQGYGWDFGAYRGEYSTHVGESAYTFNCRDVREYAELLKLTSAAGSASGCSTQRVQLSPFGRNVALFAEGLYVSSGFTVATLQTVVVTAIRSVARRPQPVTSGPPRRGVSGAQG